MKKGIIFVFIFMFSFIQIIKSQPDCGACNNVKLNEYFLTSIREKNFEKLDLYLNSGIEINGGFCTRFGGTDYLQLKKNYEGHKIGENYQCLWEFCMPYLFAAIQTNNYDVVNYFIKKGANVNLPFKVPIKTQFTSPNDDLRKDWRIVGYEEYYPLNECLNYNRMRGSIDIRIVKLLLENGAKPDYAIDDAKKLNNLNIIQLLIQYGAKFNYDIKDLQNAITNKNNNAIEFYLNAGVKPDCNCFISAVNKGDISLIDRFLRFGCDIDCAAKEPNGRLSEFNMSALCYAVKTGNLEVVKFLVENGADLNCKCGSYDNGAGGGFVSEGNDVKSLADFSDDKTRLGRSNSEITEYLLLAPGIQKRKLEERRIIVNKYRETAKIQLIDGNINKSKELFDSAYYFSRENIDKFGITFFYSRRAKYFRDSIRNIDSAVFYFKKAYDDSKSNMYYYNIAWLYQESKPDSALKIYNELDKQGWELIQINKAFCYKKMGNDKDANNNLQLALTKLLADNQNDIMVNYYLSEVYSLMEDENNCNNFLKKALKLGYKNFNLLEKDTYLDFFKKTEKYEKLIAKYKVN